MEHVILPRCVQLKGRVRWEIERGSVKSGSPRAREWSPRAYVPAEPVKPSSELPVAPRVRSLTLPHGTSCGLVYRFRPRTAGRGRGALLLCFCFKRKPLDCALF